VQLVQHRERVYLRASLRLLDFWLKLAILTEVAQPIYPVRKVFALLQHCW
jgi:hypothetical protein